MMGWTGKREGKEGREERGGRLKERGGRRRKMDKLDGEGEQEGCLIHNALRV